MKKALINPLDLIQLQNKETLQYENSTKQRVSQTIESENVFEVASPLFWIDCDDNLDPVKSYYDPDISSIVEMDDPVHFTIFVGNTDNLTERVNFAAGDTVRVSLIDTTNTVSDSCSIDWHMENGASLIDSEDPKTGTLNFSSGRIDLDITIKNSVDISESKTAKVYFMKDSVELATAKFTVTV